MAELWSTKEKHTVRRSREHHRVSICIPMASLQYIEKAVHILKNTHGAPATATLFTSAGLLNTWVVASWFVDRK